MCEMDLLDRNDHSPRRFPWSIGLNHREASNVPCKMAKWSRAVDSRPLDTGAHGTLAPILVDPAKLSSQRVRWLRFPFFPCLVFKLLGSPVLT